MTATATAPAADRREWRPVAAARRSVRGWWVVSTRPPSIAAMWRLSARVDSRRVPARSPLLTFLWYWSNRTDRVLLFALALIVPGPLTGPVLWLASRPSHRLGLYVVIVVLLLVPAVAGG